MRWFNALGALVVLAFMTTEVAQSEPRQAELTTPTRVVPRVTVGWKQTGLASWYGFHWAGRHTANGDRYNPLAMTAAHRLLPLGSTILVTRKETGTAVVLTVNDRGPYVKGRMLDLSLGAARKLGFVRDGLAVVTIEVLTVGDDTYNAFKALRTRGKFVARETPGELQADQLDSQYNPGS